MTEFPGSGAATTTTPGAILASERARMGLSIADVAGQMRISPRQVEAIESDRYGELPGAVFVRGFVRNYARLLKLDPVPLLHALEPQLGQDAPLRAHVIAGALPVPARRSHTKVWFGVLAILVACVLGAGAYELWRPQAKGSEPAATSPNTRPAVSPAKPVQPLDPAPGAPMSSEPRDRPAGESAETSSGTVPSASEMRAPGSERTAGSGVQGSSRAARIGIQFARDSWVEIRDRDGKVVFSGTGPADSLRTLDAQAPLDVIIGNASGVRITYNGKPIDVASHATRNIARFTLE